jgi:hypothetical protein
MTMDTINDVVMGAFIVLMLVCSLVVVASVW